MNMILENIVCIQSHIKNTMSIKQYKNGIIGIDTDANVIYLNLYTQTIQKIVHIDSKGFIMDCMMVDAANDTCFVMCPNKIIHVDIMAHTILSEKNIDFNIHNCTYYKDNTFIGLIQNSICLYNYDTNTVTTLLDTKESVSCVCKMVNRTLDTFEYISNKKLYVYHIQTNILESKQTKYVDINTYTITDIHDNTCVCTAQVHSCVCIYGVNKGRTKCIMGHFDPSFNNIEGVIHDIQKKLKEEYNEIELHIVGGFVHNTSLIKLLDILSSSYMIYPKEKVHNHVLKPYHVIISKQGTHVY
tara:strand:- start:1671 stop:2570 length:900 start_codon:yes stop_codon:yes gene_type:complete